MSAPTRTLAIEDFNPHGHVEPTSHASAIRLKGRWLKDAGFQPGKKVKVTPLSPGVMELRSASPAVIDAAYSIAIQHLKNALNSKPGK